MIRISHKNRSGKVKLLFCFGISSQMVLPWLPTGLPVRSYQMWVEDQLSSSRFFTRVAVGIALVLLMLLIPLAVTVEEPESMVWPKIVSGLGSVLLKFVPG